MPHSTYSKKKSFYLLEGTFLRTGKAKNGRNCSKFINRSQIFIAFPKFNATHRNHEILSKSLVPNTQFMRRKKGGSDLHGVAGKGKEQEHSVPANCLGRRDPYQGGWV
jgi:hypothetical protein